MRRAKPGKLTFQVMSDIQGLAMIGTQRSGTNLLRLMLHQEKEVVALHPPHLLQTFFPLLPHYGDSSQDESWFALCRDVCDWVAANPVPWSGVVLDAEILREKCASRSLVSLMAAIYESAATAKGARWWVNKSMGQVHFLPALEKDLPDLRYLHLYRDGRDVALSFQRAVVGHKHLYFLAQSWAKEQELAMDFIQQIGPERGISMAYETLIAHPEQELRRICRFMGIPFRPEMLEFYHSKESQQTAASGAMWANVRKPILAGNTGKYRVEMFPDEQELFEAVAGSTLAKLGYPLHTTPPGSGQVFSEAEIAMFSVENVEFQALARQRQDPRDAQKRAPQEALLRAIRQRFGI